MKVGKLKKLLIETYYYVHKNIKQTERKTENSRSILKVLTNTYTDTYKENKKNVNLHCLKSKKMK